MRRQAFSRLAAQQAVAACVLATPVQAVAAAAVADASDWTSDRTVVARISGTSTAGTNVTVQLSGETPQILQLRRLLVAVDVDQDGYLDLAGLSERRGVIILLNKRGRFTWLKKNRPSGGLSFSSTQLGRFDEGDGEQPAAQTDPLERDRLVCPHAVGILSAPRLLVALLLRSSSARHTDISDSTTSRGPPFVASA